MQTSPLQYNYASHIAEPSWVAICSILITSCMSDSTHRCSPLLTCSLKLGFEGFLEPKVKVGLQHCIPSSLVKVGLQHCIPSSLVKVGLQHCIPSSLVKVGLQHCIPSSLVLNFVHICLSNTVCAHNQQIRTSVPAHSKTLAHVVKEAHVHTYAYPHTHTHTHTHKYTQQQNKTTTKKPTI